MKIKFVLFFGFFLALNLINFELNISKSLLFEIRSNLYAQKPRYPYKKYESRKEGIVKKKQLVAGEKLVLISAAIDNFESRPKKDAAVYNLGFYLKESARVKIEVREFENYYKMQPLRIVYPPGPNSFSWPSTIPRYYEIALEDLFALAKIRGSGSNLILPIVLYYEKPQNPDMSYRFCFIPYKTINLLEYKIYNLLSKQLIFTKTLKDLPREKIICVRWNGKDKNNNPVVSGLLNLNIKATFKAPPGSVIHKTVTLNYQFYHFANLIKHELLTRK